MAVDFAQMMKLRIRSLWLAIPFALALFPSCKSFEYEPDEIMLDDKSVQLGNVGFKGFSLNPPHGYRRVSDAELRQTPEAFKWVENFRIGYRNSEGLDYHFHQDFVFQKGDQVVFFLPFQNKTVRQFRHTPPDILERYLIDWVRDAEFAKIIDYGLSWRAESDSRGHSTVILRSKRPKAGLVYEEHIMTGDLNEMFIFAGFAPEQEAASLTGDLNLFRQSLNVIR